MGKHRLCLFPLVFSKFFVHFSSFSVFTLRNLLQLYSTYNSSTSIPIPWQPNRWHATRVVPVPIKGSRTTKSSRSPCSLIHHSGSFTGNIAGWCPFSLFAEIVSYGMKSVFPRHRRLPFLPRVPRVKLLGSA